MSNTKQLPQPSTTRTFSSFQLACHLLVGLVFHLTYLRSIVDCYFGTEVVHGMKSHALQAAPAKRLMLFIGMLPVPLQEFPGRLTQVESVIVDGLRADTVFDKHAYSRISGISEPAAPYLQSTIETRGAFGVSHTRVPTETRPGHMALFCGCEDIDYLETFSDSFCPHSWCV